MSRKYRVTILVSDVSPEGEQHVIPEALESAWSEDSNETCLWSGSELYLEGDAVLSGGFREDQYAQLVAKTVWEAVDRYVPVVVYAIPLEVTPEHTHTMGEELYEEVS